MFRNLDLYHCFFVSFMGPFSSYHLLNFGLVQFPSIAFFICSPDAFSPRYTTHFHGFYAFLHHVFSSNITLEYQPIKQLSIRQLCLNIPLTQQSKQCTRQMDHLSLMSFVIPFPLCRVYSPIRPLGPRSLKLVLRVFTSCLEFGCASWRLEDSSKSLPRMLFATEFVAPFRTRDLESSPSEICEVGKDARVAVYTCSFWHSYSYYCCQSQHLVCLSAVGRHMSWAERLACWFQLLLLLKTPIQFSKSPQKRTCFPLREHAFCWAGESQGYSSIDSLTLPVHH